tara:strand:- start:49 stop:510 length:462 start_codon:yes stop_codon:yes gene_type:complete
MATLIKNNLGDVYKICLTDEHLNAQTCLQSDYDNGIYTKVDITDDEANSIRLGNKDYLNNNFVDVEAVEGQPGMNQNNFFTKAEFDNQVQADLNILTKWCENNSSNAMYTELSTYKSVLENLDSSTITFPLAKNLPGYVEDQGNTSYHALQIP